MKKLSLTIAVIFLSFSLFAQSKKLAEYAGVYKFGEGPVSQVVITVEDGSLIAETNELGAGELNPTDKEDEFGEPNYQALLKFNRNSKGNVVELVVNAQGMVLFGVKQASKDLNDYVGVYQFESAPFDYIEITLDGKELVAEASNLGAGEINPTDVEDEFGEPNYQALLKFLRNDNGTVDQVQVSGQGSVWMGRKKVDTMAEYAGVYEMKDKDFFEKVTIKYNNGVLSVETDKGNSDLNASSEKDIFLLRAVDGKIGFLRDNNTGNVIGLTIMAMGTSLEAVKK